MGRATYYSPLGLGALLMLALNESIRAQVAWLDLWQQWLVVVGVAVVFGIQCQVLMVGAQGAFAQVLPVPGGRSIRGRAAVVGGWLLMAWYALSIVAVVLGVGGMTVAVYVLGALALAVLGGAGVVYVWSVPAAVADFGDERGG